MGAKAAASSPVNPADVLSLLDRIEKGEVTSEDRALARAKKIVLSRGFFGSLGGLHAVDHIRTGTLGDVTEGVTDLVGRAAIVGGLVVGILTGTGHVDIMFGKSS